MTILGPVYDAAHGGSGNPWFPIGIASVVLVVAWIEFFRRRTKTKGPIIALLGISAICAVLIVSGILQLLKTK